MIPPKLLLVIKEFKAEFTWQKTGSRGNGGKAEKPENGKQNHGRKCRYLYDNKSKCHTFSFYELSVQVNNKNLHLGNQNSFKAVLQSLHIIVCV